MESNINRSDNLKDLTKINILIRQLKSFFDCCCEFSKDEDIYLFGGLIRDAILSELESPYAINILRKKYLNKQNRLDVDILYTDNYTDITKKIEYMDIALKFKYGQTYQREYIDEKKDEIYGTDFKNETMYFKILDQPMKIDFIVGSLINLKQYMDFTCNSFYITSSGKTECFFDSIQVINDIIKGKFRLTPISSDFMFDIKEISSRQRAAIILKRMTKMINYGWNYDNSPFGSSLLRPFFYSSSLYKSTISTTISDCQICYDQDTICFPMNCCITTNNIKYICLSCLSNYIKKIGPSQSLCPFCRQNISFELSYNN